MFNTIKEILSSIKEFIIETIKHRLFPVTILVLFLFFLIIKQLFTLQIIEGDEHQDNFIYKSKKTLTVESVRGNIYDRNGKLLAYNELSYSVKFSNDAGITEAAANAGITENEYKNDVVYRTIHILEDNGDSLFVDFPIELDSSGNFEFTVSDAKKKAFFKNVFSVTDYDSLEDEQKNADANYIMDYLCSEDRFDVSDTYSDEDKLKIVSCRYKLWLNRYQQYVPVTIAYDISDESNAAITEYSDELLGMEVTVKSLRKYNDATYFSQIIGYVGAISDDELEEYNANLDEEDQYNSDEIVGKTGIEQYCESDLRGKQGLETMYVDNLGKVIETVDEQPASAGNDVYLTIDADLQKYCYDTLEKEIASILLANIEAVSDVNEGENVKIPITDVYFGLFNNNVLKMDEMNKADSTETEKSIYEAFTENRKEVLANIDDILKTDFTSLADMDDEYQDYMEYICEYLSSNDILDTSLIPNTDSTFIKYTNNECSLEEYLKHAISLEAIDISSFDVSDTYYDTDEIYVLLCNYIVDSLSEDEEFDKHIIDYMIKSGTISGENVITLIYDQGILDADSDEEYEDYQNGKYGAYEFMLRKIKNLEITPAMLDLDPCSGSVVVTDVNTGDVLAMVSYPSYDNNYLTNEVDEEYYNTLLEDKTMPMYNRATQQKTAPGSTYKILSSVAGLTEGTISSSSYVYCSGEFDKIDPAPQCWLKGGHGSLDVETAIQYSCNVFFYQVGYSLCFDEDKNFSDTYGLERLAKYAHLFGLDTTSGVEIPETSPTVSNSDAVRSAIGQGKNSYAPIQLARYVTTIANSGTCYNLTLIDKVTDYEGNLVRDNQASVYETLDEVSESTWNTVHNGMRRVVSVFTRADALVNKVNVAVAGKTGTAQESETRPDHALFISYAPFEDPEVSVTCVIQNGYSSGNTTELAGFVYAYLYDKDLLKTAEMSGNNAVSD